MICYLVVKVWYVNYSTVSSAVVKAVMGGSSSPIQLTFQPVTGAYEMPLPSDDLSITVTVSLTAEFWPVEQKLRLKPGSPLPFWDYDGPQAINVVRTDKHRREGGGCNVEVFVVLGQLRDAFSQVKSIADASGISLIPQSLAVTRCDTPMLNPSGTGWGRLHSHSQPGVTPVGKFRIAERTKAPRLIAIYDPTTKWHNVSGSSTAPEDVPIPYHLFFHPFINPPFSRTYPFHAHYVDLFARYMLMPWSQGKAMVHQHEVTGKKGVFIFPVGSPTEQMGTLNSQTNALNLFEETNFWIQRMDGVSFPQQPVGKLAMSCFSAGVRFLAAAFLNGKTPRFHDSLLREMYFFDPVFAGTGGDTERQNFNRAMIKWHRSGADNRVFRVYTQSNDWFTDLIGDLPGASPTTGPENAKEADHASGTLLFCPANNYWKSIDSRFGFGVVHKLIPALFMEHSITNAKFL